MTAGWSIRRLPFCLPHLRHPSAPTKQHRHHNGRDYPHLSTYQQLDYPAYAPAQFTVSPSIATVNMLFFLNLPLVLIDAFLAILVKSWLQEFDRSWRKYTVADICEQERERRLQALERWKLAELVTLRPILLQTSLLFFCIGFIVVPMEVELREVLWTRPWRQMIGWSV